MYEKHFLHNDHDNQIIPPAIGGNVADGKGSDIATSMAVIQSKMVNLKEKVNVYIHVPVS